MKYLIALISLVFLSSSALGQAFQYRPTAYTQPFVSTINSAAAAQAYLGVPSATNIALLNTNQTWTGTPTFPAAVFLTNGIYERWLMTTNLTFYGNASTNAAYPTNAGDYASLTPIVSFTCPALIGANSALRFRVVLDKTNTTTTTAAIFVYAGPSTNWAGVAESPGTVALGASERYFGPFLRNFGSFTNQIANSTATWLNYAQKPARVVDTSSPFQVYVGLTTTGSAIGIGVRQIVVTELVVP